MSFKSLFQTITGQTWGPTTVVSVLVTLLCAIAGGVVVIVDPSTLSFKDYVQDLGVLAGGNGLVAIGRGLHLGGVARQLGVSGVLNTAAETVVKDAGTFGHGKVETVATQAAQDALEILNPPPAESPTPVAVPEPTPAA